MMQRQRLARGRRVPEKGAVGAPTGERKFNPKYRQVGGRPAGSTEQARSAAGMGVGAVATFTSSGEQKMMKFESFTSTPASFDPLDCPENYL
jgi:hypothetical protein